MSDLRRWTRVTPSRCSSSEAPLSGATFRDSRAVRELDPPPGRAPARDRAAAAARVELLGPEQLLERIGQRLDLLKGGRDADERHATLRTTIAWSYDLLDDDEQQLFARLAVFRGGCTLEAAEAVCGSELDTLASLLDKSLVRRRPDANGDERFSMLDTIREFARERLDASGEEDALPPLPTGWLLDRRSRGHARDCRRPRRVGCRSRLARDRQRPRRARLGGRSTTPSVASPWPRRSRDSRSFANPAGDVTFEPLLAEPRRRTGTARPRASGTRRCARPLRRRRTGPRPRTGRA